MAQQVFPTKSNLMATKRSLALATQGYDLMDRKRNILVREMMQLIDRAAIETHYQAGQDQRHRRQTFAPRDAKHQRPHQTSPSQRRKLRGQHARDGP